MNPYGLVCIASGISRVKVSLRVDPLFKRTKGSAKQWAITCYSEFQISRT